MSDSVGKISLDLELQGDLGKQINEEAGKIGEQLKASLQNIGNVNFKALADNISNSLKKSIDGSMDAIKGTIEKTLNSALAGATAGTKKIKIPVDFGIPTNSLPQKETAVSSLAQLRAPPIPKINTGVNIDVVKAQIDNLTQSLDITNAKIEQQRQKLAQLRESYDRAFDGSRKNKLQEQILNTEATINKLTAVSDRTGFKLADLDKKFEILGASAKQATSGVAAVTETLKKTSNVSNKAGGNFRAMKRSVDNAGGSFRNSHNSLKMFFGTMVKWGIIFPIISRAIFGMATFLGQAFMANTQFANSLNQIKSNLYTAFMPIYQAVLPAINTLMAGLSRITAYIASFTNALFGKTYNQSFQAAKGLIAAKTEMGAYGNAAKKAAKDAKGALAGFDEINQLQSGKGSNDSSGGIDKVPKMVMPDVDTSALDKSMGGLADKFKTVLGTIFQPFKSAWNAVGPSVTAEFNRAIEGTKATLNNFFNMLATPPVQKFMQSIGELGLTIGKLLLFVYNNYVLPLGNWIISNAPGIASALTPIINNVTNFLNWLMGDGKPILDVIVIVLGSLALAFGVVTTAVKIFNTVTGLISLITSPIGIAVLAVGALIAIGILLYKNWDYLKAKASEVWLGIKVAFAAFSYWLGTVFATDWSEKFGVFGGVVNGLLHSIKDVFSGIKQVFKGIIDFVAGVFTGDWRRAWDGVKEVFSGIVNTFGAIMRAPLNAVIGLINGAISSINKIKVPKIDLPFGMGTVGGWNLSIPKIPYLAKGGVINQPTLAMVGEAGKEAVMPLENNTGWIDSLADKISGRIGASNDVLDVLKQILLKISSQNGDLVLQVGENDLARTAINAINRYQRQAGKTLLNV
ncbi:hypothetical protein HMPREF1982_02681 [Clostridiales bacterium oral taxon 876 str. F0540]|nr:hypothetical protein HMPREF1982_02681 [Clostridiales bacterium oral taxon 876 str. F0540]